MRARDVYALDHGLYRIFWKGDDGGFSVAAVGSDASGRRWFAPTNWITVPCFDWKQVRSVEPIADRRSVRQPNLGHGLYRLVWKGEGGGTSVAAIGSDASGRRWFAPTDWTSVPSFDWTQVQSAELIADRQMMDGQRPS